MTIDRKKNFKKWEYTLNVFNLGPQMVRVSTKTYVVSTKKYCLNETVIMSTQSIKPCLHTGLQRLQYFVKVYTNSKI